MTVKLGTLVNGEETLKKFGDVQMKKISGKKALEIRKFLKALNEEVASFNESRDSYIRENGTVEEDGNIAISDPVEQQKAIEWINGLANADVEVSWPAFLDDETMEVIGEELGITINEMDLLESVGIISDSAEEEE